MTTNCWKSSVMERCLLLISMVVSALGESTDPTLPPTTSEQPNARDTQFLILGVSFAVFILIVCVIIISLHCRRCRRRSRARTEYSSHRYETTGERVSSLRYETTGERAMESCEVLRMKSVGGEDREMECGNVFRSLHRYEYEDGQVEICDVLRMESYEDREMSISLRNCKMITQKEYPIELDTMSTQKSVDTNRRFEIEDEMDVSLFLYKERYIDIHGGVLVLPEAEVSLTIPPGAIKDGCIISINVVPTNLVSLPGQGELPRLTPFVICEPDGLNFEIPVELIVPHCGIIDDPGDHTVNVKFGKKDRYFSRDMTWIAEDVEYKLTRTFCHIFLKHFSGVNVNISGTKEKMLRAIPFASAIDDEEIDEDLILNMWLCNDLAADYLTLVKNEIKSKYIPLDSYDTFRLNTSDHQHKTYIEVTTEAAEGSNWLPERNAKKLDIHGLTTGTKSKCTFRYVNSGDQTKDYFYASMRLKQQIEEDERETLFVLRKRMSDLTLNSDCLKAENPFLTSNSCLSDSGRPPSEDPPKSCIAVPFVDPMLDNHDDIILTVWLLPEGSTDQVLSDIEKEQKQLAKIKLDTENTFTIRDGRKPIMCIIRFRKGNWKPKREKMEVELGKVLCGNRAKFPFICQKETTDDANGIDVEITIAQEGEMNQTEFMKRKRVDEFFFGSIKPVTNILLNTKPPGNSSRKFETLCQSLIDGLSKENCHYVATYFNFEPAYMEKVLSSDRPAEVLIQMLTQRLLFTPTKLGWLQNALTRIHRNDLAETIGRLKAENQGV